MNCFISIHKLDIDTIKVILTAIVEHLPTNGPLEYRLERTGKYEFKTYKVENPAVWMMTHWPAMESAFLADANEDGCTSIAISVLPDSFIVGGERVFRATIVFPEVLEFIAHSRTGARVGSDDAHCGICGHDAWFMM